MQVIDYAVAGPLTTLDGIPRAALEPIGNDPVEICLPIHELVIQLTDERVAKLPSDRKAENQIRPAAALVHRLLSLDPAPLSVGRAPEKRVVGTCRHFAVLACALLRYRGIPARVRCGFATYFQPGQGLDHWIAEYWAAAGAGWVRIDAEILGQSIVQRPHDLQPGEFLTGGEAWSAYRRREIDAAVFGVYATENWGPAEIRGNAVKDLAALNKVETLPWDEWGRMTEAYQGTTGADYDELLDILAAACAANDPATIATLYARKEFQVPATLIA